MVPKKASSAERFLETGDRTSPVTNEGAVESGARTAELGTASPTPATLLNPIQKHEELNKARA